MLMGVGTSLVVGIYNLVLPSLSEIRKAGWGQGGIYLAQLTWLDGLNDEPTSMPIPTPIAPIPVVFNSTIHSWFLPEENTQLLYTPSGLNVGM